VPPVASGLDWGTKTAGLQFPMGSELWVRKALNRLSGQRCCGYRKRKGRKYLRA
jgi:hypothetical protein